MQLSAILSATLGLSKLWRVNNVVVSDDSRRLDVSIDFVQDDLPQCTHCGLQANPGEFEICTWEHKDFLNYETYLHTRTPRVACCGSRPEIIPPWAQKSSKFVKLQTSAA